MTTYSASIGFLARMDAHVNEQFVAGVERTVATRASGPETGKILGPPLIDVTAFDVLDELFLGVVRAFAIDPSTMKHRYLVTNVVVFFLFFVGGQLARPIVHVRVMMLVNGRELESLVVLRRRRHEWRLGHTVTITARADARSGR